MRNTKKMGGLKENKKLNKRQTKIKEIVHEGTGRHIDKLVGKKGR